MRIRLLLNKEDEEKGLNAFANCSEDSVLRLYKELNGIATRMQSFSAKMSTRLVEKLISP